MLINFCDPSLNPEFSCKEPSHEGYEVTNLASKNFAERSNGFLAYGSPPTTVNIKFLSSVNIEHIVIWSQVRSQKSLGFELLLRSASKKNHKWQSYGWQGSQLSSTFSGPDDSFHRVGSIILGNEDKGVVFSRCGSHVNKEQVHSNFAQKALLRHYALGNVDTLQIKIFKTASTAPAIGKVQVWGTPGNACSGKVKRDVLNLWENRNQNKQEYLNVSQSNESTVEAISSKVQIPDEFLDSITYHLMSLPFILPSGKVVDVQTIEKHEEYEAKYGRAPSDPFTGLPYSKECRPVHDMALKRRIDQFLLENSQDEELSKIPRTTGTKAGHELEQKIYKHNLSFRFFNSTNEHKLKRSRDIDSEVEDNVKRVKVNLDSKCETSVLPTSLCPGVLQVRSVSFPRTQTLYGSSNDILEDTSRGEKNSTTSTAISLKIKENFCADCNNPENLFRLPCSHLICRTCLLYRKDKKLLNCSKCRLKYESCNAVRFHCGSSNWDL